MSKRKDSGVSIFQRADGRWVIAYQIEPGQWRQHVLAATEERGAKREGHRWLAEQRASGTLSATKRIGDLWRPWLKLRAANPNLATSTVRDNESQFERDLKPFYEVPIGELDEKKIRDFVRAFREGRSASKVRNVVSTLSAFYEDARAEGWVKSQVNVVRHPAVTKELPAPKQGGQPVYLPLERAQRIAAEAAIPEHRRVLYTVAFTSGARDGELHGLKWSDVHLDAEIPYMRIDRAFAMKASPDKYADLTDTKTAGSVRSIPLHEAARSALRWWRDEGWAFFVGRKPVPSDPVFASVNGAHWRPKSAREIREDLEAVGLPTANDNGEDFDFHATRRSFSTWLADAGVDDATVGMLLGHVGKSTATRHYTAAVLRRLASAVALIAFRWQDPAPLGGPSGGGTTHSAETVREHREGQDQQPKTSENQELAPVAQWIEQRFPNLPTSLPESAFSHLAHNDAAVCGNEADQASAEHARYETRASRFDGKRRERRQKREAIRRQRDDEVTRLLLEGKRVAMGDTDVEKAQRPAYLRALLRRCEELRRANADHKKGAA